MMGVSSADGITPKPFEIDPSTGGVIVDATVTTGATTSANCYTGQTTVNTTQVQVDSSSHVLNNGIIIKSLSTNSAPIYVGLTGVTDTTGDIIEPGEARGYAVNNTNLLYIISAASTTDVISFSAN
jgi:hypothetical protein